MHPNGEQGVQKHDIAGGEGGVRGWGEGRGELTRLVSGSWTDLTRLLISLRMAFAATPVVAVLKSMWEAPRTRALKDSLLGMRESEGMAAALWGMVSRGDGGGAMRGTCLGLMWMGTVVAVEMREGAEFVRGGGGRGLWWRL